MDHGEPAGAKLVQVAREATDGGVQQPLAGNLALLGELNEGDLP